MAQTNINIRIDDVLKKQFDALCQELGMTMTTAFNMFAKAVVRHKGIPFDISLNIPNAETRQAIEDAENHRNLYGPFDTVEEAIKAMLDDKEE